MNGDSGRAEDGGPRDAQHDVGSSLDSGPAEGRVTFGPLASSGERCRGWDDPPEPLPSPEPPVGRPTVRWVLDLEADPLGRGDTGVGALRGVVIGVDETMWSVGPAYGNPGVVAIRDGRIQGRLDGVAGSLAAAPDGTVFSRVPRGAPCGFGCAHEDGSIVNLRATSEGVARVSSMRLASSLDETRVRPSLAIGPRGMVFTVVGEDRLVATCRGRRVMWSRRLQADAHVELASIRTLLVDSEGTLIAHVRSEVPEQSRIVVLGRNGEILADGDDGRVVHEIVAGMMDGSAALIGSTFSGAERAIAYRSSVAAEEWSSRTVFGPSDLRLLPDGRALHVSDGPLVAVYSGEGVRSELVSVPEFWHRSLVLGATQGFWFGAEGERMELRYGPYADVPTSEYDVVEFDVDGWRGGVTQGSDRPVYAAGDGMALSPSGILYIAAGRYAFAVATGTETVSNESCLNAGCNHRRDGRISDVFDYRMLTEDGGDVE